MAQSTAVTLELTQDDARNLIAFLNRCTLQGTESKTHADLKERLQAALENAAND